MRLLFVEDEARLIELVGAALRQAGFVADCVRLLAEAREAVTLIPYDAVILDLGLPDGNGIALVEQVRRSGDKVPMLILTARDAIDDRVAGLDAGADDYLVKPFAMVELVARTKALLRRPGGALGAVLAAGDVQLDTRGRDVRVGDSVVDLSRREVAILEHLLRRLGRVVPKSLLEEKLYGLDDEPESDPIPVHIHHLRRKLADAGARTEIHTVRGLGYMVTDKRR